MAEKRESLETLARREAEGVQAQAARAAERQTEAERLVREVPQRFFGWALKVREAVARFNGAADPGRRLAYRESPALAAQDQSADADRRLGFSRTGAEAELLLRALSRAGRPDVFLIEASGRLGAEPFLLRGEGFVAGGAVTFRLSLDLQRLSWPADELPERLVHAVVTASRQSLL
jgi:hypothetical protein